MRNYPLPLNPTVHCPIDRRRGHHINLRADSWCNIHLAATLAVLATLLVALLTAILTDTVGSGRADSVTHASAPRVTTTSSAGVLGVDRVSPSRVRPIGTERARQLATSAAPWLVNLINHRSDHAQLSGTGIVIRGDGLILTNAHVVMHARQLVAITDAGAGATLRARIVRIDRIHDLALVKIRLSRSLPIAPLGNSDTLHPGDEVGSLGNAWGLNELWIAAGPITGLHRSIPSTTATTHPLRSLIEVRSLVSPGQSGGALITATGRVVGINVAYTHTDGSSAPAGTGYAIPINNALTILGPSIHRSEHSLT